MTERPHPTELRLKNAGTLLAVTFDNGERHELTAEYLRVESPSAEVKGHHSGQARTVAGKKAVTIAAIEPVGNYAVRLRFSDGHDTGLYSWDYLLKLGRGHKEIWGRYLAGLREQGLARD